MAGFELYNHQKLVLQYMTVFPQFALFMEQGTGKTLPTLCRLLDLYREGAIQNALIVAPKSTMGAWERDMEMFGSDADTLRSFITVVNYDMVWRRKKYDREWDAIVLDESHFIKNHTSKRAAFLLKLALKSSYRYILTGTPIGNGRLEDIWSQFAFLYPRLNRGRVASEILGTRTEFLERYCLLNQWWQPYKYINVAELQEIIEAHSYRVTKEECLDLPDKLPDEVWDVELKEPKIYKELHEESTLLEHDLLAPNSLVRMAKLRQVCSGFLQLEDEILNLKCEKPKILKDFLENWDKKLVIFCNFRYSIEVVSKLLQKLKIEYVTLDGEQEDKNIWRRFQEDDSVQVIVCQYQSAAQGVDLYAADTIIYYEPTLSSTILEQSRDRIHRVGQASKCSYIHLITKGTIERAIYKALQGYSDFSEKLFTEYMGQYTRSYAGGHK